MAAPTINLVDPVGVTPQSPWGIEPAITPCGDQLGHHTIYGGTPEKTLGDEATVVLGIPIDSAMVAPPEPPTIDIPAPPMGQIFINTFPSIYKTRGALPFGQIHPPPVPKE